MSQPHTSTLRLLFFTQDTSVLEVGTPTATRMIDLQTLFAEVHVVLLNYASKKQEARIVRLGEAVWVYATHSTSWWHLSIDAYKTARAQMSFGGGFRADVIIAEDVFEAGLAGYRIARAHKRPFHIHVYEDFYDESYIENHRHPALYTMISEYVLKKATTVRTKTDFQKEAVQALCGNEADVGILPAYFDLALWRASPLVFDLHERYPKFKFIILHVTSMHASTNSHDVLLGVSSVLRAYPTVGLVIVGNGPLRSQLERQAIALGLEKSIVFEPTPDDVCSHIKSANMFIHHATDSADDDALLCAATVGTPIVSVTSGIGGRLFVDGESAHLCPLHDIACMTRGINRLLNDHYTRTQFALRAYESVSERIEQDYRAYLEAYASSIQRSLAVES